MIKVNVEINSKSWHKKIKNPKKYFSKKLKKISKIVKFFKGKNITFTILLTNSINMKKLNKKFRNKNKSTDVLSFPFYSSNNLKIIKQKKLYIGDVAVSYEIINLRSKKNNFFREFNKVWVHGLLHLIGYDHVKDKDYSKMIKMEKRILGNSGIKVSCLGLGTMTFGQQNTEKEALAQMDCALSFGVNLFDTAEMYPVPPLKETYTRTEQFIGKWIKLRKCRENIILATKVVGPTSDSRGMRGYIRDGLLNSKNIIQALEGSLIRLGTETIDLYQIHWPYRNVNIFGKRDFEAPKFIESENSGIEETLETLDKLKTSGKIRAFGVSNEISLV